MDCFGAGTCQPGPTEKIICNIVRRLYEVVCINIGKSWNFQIQVAYGGLQESYKIMNSSLFHATDAE